LKPPPDSSRPGLEITDAPNSHVPAAVAGGWSRWTWLLVAVPWLALINHLRLEWEVNAQYGYGFVVPILAVYLGLLRWTDRPAPSRAPNGLLLAALAALGAFAFAPLRLVVEANPDWRFMSWSLAAVTVGLSFCLLCWLGGWRWVRHFAFPVAFIFVAVPWPMPWENRMVGTLMEGNASLAATVANLLGISAVAQQNIIQLGNGYVGVDDACSGVRSLQTTLMIALFFGEWFRFSLIRRIAMILAAALLAIGCNFLRILFLTLLCAEAGQEAIEPWHDPAGWAVVAVTFVGLWAMAKGLARGLDEVSLSSATGATESVAKAPRAWPKLAMVIVVLWYGFAEAGTQAWYAWHESKQSPPVRWTVNWPKTAPGLQILPIPETTRALLKYQRGTSATWLGENGEARWNGYFFRWDASHTSSILARSHRPDICLPATGRKMVKEFGAMDFHVAGLNLPLAAYQFSDRGQPLFVFYCAWEDRHPDEIKVGTGQKAGNVLNWHNRLQTVLAGRRNSGQQVLEIALWGSPTLEHARQQFAAELQKLVVRTGGQ
jgi:exosortase